MDIQVQVNRVLTGYVTVDAGDAFEAVRIAEENIDLLSVIPLEENVYFSPLSVNIEE